MKKITKKDFLQFAADNLNDEDMVTYANEQLVILEEREAKAKAKNEEKKKEDVNRIQEFINAYMDDPAEIYTSPELAEIAGISPQKATANLRKAEEFGMIVSKPNAGIGASSRKIKGYALDITAFDA